MLRGARSPRNQPPHALLAEQTPYPGTGSHARLEQQGRITTNNWDLYDTRHVAYRPARLSPEALKRGDDWAYREFYRWPSIDAVARSGVVGGHGVHGGNGDGDYGGNRDHRRNGGTETKQRRQKNLLSVILRFSVPPVNSVPFVTSVPVPSVTSVLDAGIMRA
jgi:hypothetical protein